MKTKILEQLRTSEAEMLQFLEQLVNIDSGADALDGINQVADKIGAFLAPLGFELQYLETTEAPVQLLARRARAGKKQVLFRAIWIRFLIRARRLPGPSKSKTAGPMGPVCWI